MGKKWWWLLFLLCFGSVISDDNEDYSAESEDDAKVYKNPRNSPSVECPRDEEHAEFIGQKCLRKCSNDEDCKSKKKKCLCDGVCGMSCIKPERECADLQSPSLGSVTLSGRLFGDSATYTCDPGYHLVGLKERTCRGDGEWTGAPAQCRHNVFCKEPQEIPHARHNALPQQTTFPLDTELQYQCHLGYTTKGFPTAKCLALDKSASWFGPDITCEPKSCGTPPHLSNGYHVGDCYTFGCKITYSCSDGYELVGRSTRVCQADGIWSPKEQLPACVPVECPVPESPPFGTAVYTSCQYNSVVSYECKYGYTLVGNATRRCGADRKWSGSPPKCQVIDCGKPGPLYNGWIENLEAGTGLGASIIFRCHEGMTLQGNTSSVCQLDGTWRYPLPLCLAPCVVPVVAQGRVSINAEMNSSAHVMSEPVLVDHGKELILQCEQRYEANTSDSPVVCNNGSWTQIPRCIPARCKQLPNVPKNGMIIAPKTDHGMKARFACKDGYVLKGENTTECRYGTWSSAHPYCQEVHCPFPGYVENGKVLLVGNMGLYDYRPYVRKVSNNKQIMYECNKGYTLLGDPPGATCIGGHWSPKELPRCVPGLHPRLRWSRKKRSIILRRLRRIKRALGAANAQIPRKPASTPNKPETSSAGSGRHKGSSKSGDIKDVSDDKEGYGSEDGDKIEGSGSVDGQHHKHKGNRTKARRGGGPCSPISLENYTKLEILKKGGGSGRRVSGKLHPVDKGGGVRGSLGPGIKNATYPHGTSVKLICSVGFASNVPNGTAKCVRAKWRPAKPKCQVAPCKIPATEEGVFTRPGGDAAVAGEIVQDNGYVQHAETVDFSCRVGYNVHGPDAIRCWHGQWNVSVLPFCTPAPCMLPKIPNGQYLLGYRPGLTIGNGSSVRFQCDTEYRPSTSEPITCVLGELRPTQPHCKPDPGSLYMAGGDITKAGEMGSVDYISGLRGSCGPPARIEGSLVYKKGEPLAQAERNFPDGTEVTFNCIASIMGEKVTWTIICQDGSWLGHSLNCEFEDGQKKVGGGVGGRFGGIGIGPRDNTTCLFTNSEPNVATFYQDQLVTEESVEFPSGAELQFRCADIGKFAMIGSNRRRCNAGSWDGVRPACFGLNQENDYLLEKPPTILFRHELGPIAQSNDGKLIVYPATSLHMECLWIRRFGTPKWAVSHKFRKYPEAWNTEPGRDSQLEYRLSILHASKDDSGTFTCITPTRHTHSVEIIVKAVHCQPLPARRGLAMSTQETKMNTKVVMSCTNGNSLIGAHELTCLPSGNWSAPMPVCQSMECPELANLPDRRLRTSIISREVGGQVVFSCSPGYGLDGPQHSTCLASGEWATPFPTCVEVQCTPPTAPENGYLAGRSTTYKAGDLVQFSCNHDFMMSGQPIIACQENGRWSGPTPSCVRACSYPGTVISGSISSVKFHYRIGETVTFQCDQGLTMEGPAMLTCLPTAKWSSNIPVCKHQ
ncbi:hig-anchoring scaffold protein isoform X2 [Rhodnius prolixus]|uniref:hig-anchoring scaffold protein isoform X2 n=1 Tax=Rhodnius prolixus TaxID=13249 RepID=UPI003D18A5A7